MGSEDDAGRPFGLLEPLADPLVDRRLAKRDRGGGVAPDRAHHTEAGLRLDLERKVGGPGEIGAVGAAGSGGDLAEDQPRRRVRPSAQ